MVVESCASIDASSGLGLASPSCVADVRGNRLVIALEAVEDLGKSPNLSASYTI